MADTKKTKKLLNEKSYRRMQVFAGLLTEAQAEQMDEEDAIAGSGSDDINEGEDHEGEAKALGLDKKPDTTQRQLPRDGKRFSGDRETTKDTPVKKVWESEELTATKPKDDPLYKDAKGTDKLAKNQKGGPSAKLEKVSKPTFNLKESDLPPMPGTDPGGFDSDLGGETDPNPGLEDEKLTVDADEFSNDLALGLSQALQKHFGNKISVTAGGSTPDEAGAEEGFEDIPLEDGGGEGMPGEEGGLGGEEDFGAPPAPAGPPVPPQNPDEERKQFESKKNKLMESMVNKIMGQIVKGSKK